MIAAEAPGKLYVLGEYAVVEPGHRAVLVAVDRYVRVEIEAREDAGSFHSEAAGAEGPLTWCHARDGVGDTLIEFGGDTTGFYRYVTAAMTTVERLRAESGLPGSHYALSVSSDLDDAASGTKLGLGSSAAVTVAAVAAVAAFYGLEVTAEQTYRLAMMATVQVTASTSGGDLAASALGGWVSYASPDRQWLAGQLAEGRCIGDLLETDWPGLRLERLDAGQDVPVQVRIGWTGHPADTPDLVHRVRRTASIPADLLERSDANVVAFLEVLEGDGSAGPILASARTVLAELAALRGTVIETPALETLCRIALETGWWAKSSGAGGGDCGIALAPRHQDPEPLSRAWEAAGIRALDLDVAATGVVLSDLQDLTTGPTAQIAAPEAASAAPAQSAPEPDSRPVRTPVPEEGARP